MEKRPHLLGGAAWSAVNAAAGVALPFAIFILFARWLEPAQVGVAVLGTSIAEILKSFGAPGLYEALLQQGPKARRHNETASAVLLATGAALALAFAAAMLLLAGSVPAIHAAGPVLALLGLRIFFDLATLQPQAALAQRLAFGRMAVRSIAANTGAGAVGLAIGLLGHPFAGLIAYLAAQSALMFATTVIGTRSLARPRFDRVCLADMRGEAKAASVVRLVAALNNTADQIVIAGVIGPARLAFFNLGKRVETTFITAAASFSMILFQPLFAQDEAGRAAGLRRGLVMLTLVCGLPAAFVVVNAEAVVSTVFGPRWGAAAPVVAILAVSGFARALGAVHGALLSVSRRNRSLMAVTCVSATSGIALVLAAQGFGITAVAACLAAKNIVMVAWMAHLTRDAAPAPWRAYAGCVLLPWGAMLAAGLAAAQLLPLDGAAALLASGAAITATAAIVLLGVTNLAHKAAARAAAPTWSFDTP